MPTIHAPRRHSTARKPRTSRLFLTINETVYSVRSLACDELIALRAYQLRKADGTHYDVTQTVFGPECDCPDFVFRRDGLDPDGCKHVQALVAHGLIAARDEDDDEPLVARR